jgi:argininosuccinate lyase
VTPSPRHQERLGTGPAELIQEAYGAPHIQTELAAFDLHLAAHRAHLVMLVERGIVDRKRASALFDALDDLERSGPESMQLRPEYNDLFTCTEVHLISRLGEDVAGRLHTGRSRNDLAVALARLRARSGLLHLVDALLHLQRTLLASAEDHIETLFPGYTHHSQQAQPVTFAHFLLAHHDALARDVERLEAAYDRLNRSPLGAAALAGTGFDIDRERLAALLGFDGLVENTQDAAGGRDFQLEVAAAAAILCSTLGRLAESLILYTSTEFGYVELDDALASVSSIMPQKKNPVALEIVEAANARVFGHLATLGTLLKSTTLGHGREIGYCDAEVDAVLVDARTAVRLMAAVIGALRIRPDRVVAGLASGLSTTTELADRLVRDHGLSFRQAHRVVGLAVARALSGSAMPLLTVEIVNGAARDLLGRELALSDEFLTAALDPWEGVRARRTRGGPAPPEVRRMLVERVEQAAVAQDRLRRRRGAIEEARARLHDAVRSARTR